MCQWRHMVGFIFPDGKLLGSGGRNCLVLPWKKIGEKKALCHTNYANSMSNCEIPLCKKKRMKQGREKRKAAIVRIEIKKIWFQLQLSSPSRALQKNPVPPPLMPPELHFPLSLCPTVSQWACWLGLK